MSIRERFVYGAKTDAGLNRDNNEDCYSLIDQASDHHDVCQCGAMFIVADGMGGHAAGEKASAMACEGLTRLYYEKCKAGQADGHGSDRDVLAHAFHAVHQDIRQYAWDNPELQGMGTTLSLLVIKSDAVLIAHVGDSRIYRLRDQNLRQLTPDHTQVQALLDMGRLKPEKAQEHPLRHMLTQAIGVDEDLEEVFLYGETPVAGDVYLLCSDGLHDMVDDDTICRILLESLASPVQAAEKLVQKALELGGEDNVTVVVVKIAASAAGGQQSPEDFR